MLKISNIAVETDSGKTILSNFDLELKANQIQVIMGPNGAGKSTLSHVIAGKSDYVVINGSISLNGEDITTLDITERSLRGIFVSFQHPVEIEGISCMNFLQASLNLFRKSRGEEPIDKAEFIRKVREIASELNISTDMLKRSMNVGFSGGEKKRMEALQMILLEPKVIILDEADSGLDVDSVKILASAINNLKKPDTTIMLITHYQRLIEYLSCDTVHILCKGKIIKTGDMSLAHDIEKNGYDAYCSCAS